MWTVEEVAPLLFENDSFGSELTECESVLVPPRDCPSVLRWIESKYRIPRHIKRVNKCIGQNGIYLQIIVRPMFEAEIDYPEFITHYEFGKVMVPWEPPMKKEDYDKWTGWPCKWYVPNWQPKTLEWSDDDLNRLYKNLKDDSLKESGGHLGCKTNSCIIVDDKEGILKITARSHEDRSIVSDSVWSKRMCSLLADHSVMKALRDLSYRVRENESKMEMANIAIDGIDVNVSSTPKNRLRVGRRTGTERNVIKKMMKASESKAVPVYIGNEIDNNRYDNDVSASQYYATGLTAAVYGSDICLMCAMALVHSRISRLLIFDDSGESDTSFELFRSKLIRMHSDEKRLNHTFTVYVIKKNN